MARKGKTTRKLHFIVNMVRRTESNKESRYLFVNNMLTVQLGMDKTQITKYM